MFRKAIVLILTLLLTVALLTGCQGKAPAAEDTPETTDQGEVAESEAPASAEATTLTFWTFQNAHQEFLMDAANTWNEENPDRLINLEASVYSYDDNHNNLLIALQSGTGAPDMVDIEIGRFANYLKGTPQLVPLNNVIEPLQDKLIMSRFENYAKDGNYYGIDYHVGMMVIYYNTEICDAAGIDIDAIKTWDDYVEAGKTVVEKTGTPMTTLEIQEHWSYYPLETEAGTDWLGPDGSVTLDSQENIDVLQFLYDMMYVDKIAVAAPGGFHHAEEYYGFMNDGGAASLWMPEWYLNRFTDYMPDLSGKIAVRPLPRWTEDGSYAAGMGGTGTAVTNQCENPELAADFLAYAKLSEEGAIKCWTVLGFDPLRWDVWSMDEMKADNKFTEYYGTGIFDMLSELREEVEIPAINIGEKFPNAQTLVQSSVVFKVLSEQSMTPEEALTTAAEELRAQ